MTLAATFGTGEVFWSFLWFFMFFIFIMLIFQIFGDIIRSDDLSGWGKALWSLFIIFVPFLGIFIYVIARGGKMSERDIKAAQANEAAMQSTSATRPAAPTRPRSWRSSPTCTRAASSTTPSTPPPRPKSSPDGHRADPCTRSMLRPVSAEHVPRGDGPSMPARP